MANLELMSMLLLALPRSCRLLLVGDENQIPAIGAGNVLGDVIASGIIPVARLTKTHRQAEGSGILDAARDILAGQEPSCSEDVHVEFVKDDKAGAERMLELAQENYRSYRPFDFQIIEPSKKHYAGTWHMNQLIHSNVVFSQLSLSGGEVSPSIMVGDKVMFTINEYDAKNKSFLYTNGEMAIVTYIGEDGVEVQDETGDCKFLPRSALSDMEMAYSYTIHKAQGSESNVIVVYIPRSKAHMLDRNLLYTAVTRAKEELYIICSGDALDIAISTTKVRRTTLCERIKN